MQQVGEDEALKPEADALLMIRQPPRVLDNSILRLAYRCRDNSEKEVVHWGQRKLTISELEFMTMVFAEKGMVIKQENTTVIYAGAAPGTHIEVLIELFPSVEWILVDPVKFGLRDFPKVTKVQGLFTDRLANQYSTELRAAGRHILFISDIRTANWRYMSHVQNEQHIKDDNDDQMRWAQILQADSSMLKFRLPYAKGKTDYLAGEIRFQVWAPPSSTETRLITSNYDSVVSYDHQIYEEQLFYFNTEIRGNSRFPHNAKAPGLDDKYDSAAEVSILFKYLQYKCPDATPTVKDIQQLSMLISSIIGLSEDKLSDRLSESNRRKRSSLR